MSVFSSLPKDLLNYGLFFPFPLISSVEISWSFTIDAVSSIPLVSPDGTSTTTVSGSGGGTLTILPDSDIVGNNSPENITPGRFRVTRRLSGAAASNAAATNFRLWRTAAAGSGSWSVDTTVEDDYVDPAEPDTTTTTTDANADAELSLVLTIGPTSVAVDEFNIVGLNLWQAPSGWTFARSGLFEAQTYTETLTAAELGYDSGSGYSQSMSITCAAWPS